MAVHNRSVWPYLKLSSDCLSVMATRMVFITSASFLMISDNTEHCMSQQHKERIIFNRMKIQHDERRNSAQMAV